MAENITRIEPFDMGKVICEPAEHKGLFISLENGNKKDEFVIVACDNSTGDAFVEEFDSVREAVMWLKRYLIDREDNNG